MSDRESKPNSAVPPRGDLLNWRSWNWQVRIAIIAVAVIAVFALYNAVHTAGMNARLLRYEADKTPADVTLTNFAVAEAKPIYARQCASCHGAEMKGDTRRGVPNLADNDWLYGTGRVAEIEKTILYGIRSKHPKAWNLAEMPGFAKPIPAATYKTVPLTPQEIRDIVEYLRLIEDKDSDPAAAARGVKLYGDKGQCFDCHSTDGRGDEAIGAPNLTDTIWLYGDGSRASVTNSVSHGHHGVCPAWIYKLAPAQIRALAVYIYTASHNSAPASASTSAPTSAKS